MTIAVHVAPEAHYSWILGRTSADATPFFRAIEAIDQTGRIAGMVGFDLWTKASCHLHVALDSPAACKGLLRETFERLFVRWGMRAALAVIRASNEASLRLVRGLGFRELYRVRDGWDAGEDLIGFEMRRGDCRWLRQARKAA